MVTHRSAKVGGNRQDHLGFAIARTAEGLQLRWRSRMLNSSYPNNEVPLEMRANIRQAVERETG